MATPSFVWMWGQRNVPPERCGFMPPGRSTARAQQESAGGGREGGEDEAMRARGEAEGKYLDREA